MSTALYLIPSSLGTEAPENFLSPPDLALVRTLKYFIVENSKTARAFLKACAIEHAQADLVLFELDKHDPAQDVDVMLDALKQGHSLGLLSEAGCPAVADPGSRVVAAAHRQGLKVKPLTGPSSILLALMASGMEGQRFAFHGYLPYDKEERVKALQRLEKEAQQRDQTQIFIETPYRNNALLKDLVQHLQKGTKLCIASGLHSDRESIQTKSIAAWSKSLPDINKVPTVFLML